MATLAQLNVVIGASIDDFEAKMAKVQYGIGRLGDAAKSAGQSLTTYVTLPLGLLAGAALRAYGKIDSLRRGLEAVTTQQLGEAGSNGLQAIAQAAIDTKERLAELQTIAKAPGIGFEQSVRGDIRLRAVGFAAEDSAAALREFANAIATTGGSAADLDGVTVQLAQMSAKGKVLAQDLRPIIERAPLAASALKTLFGTVDSESISKSLEKAGKSSGDFINMLVSELAKAPRVTGGFANSLENAGQAATQSGAKFGEVAEKLYNISGIVDGVSDYLAKLADDFAALPPSTQRFVFGLGAVVAAVGPAAVALGTIGAAIPAIVAGFGAVSAGLAAVVSPAGLAVAAVAALAGGLYYLATANERAYSSFLEQSAATQRLVTDISPLLDRYDALKAKTELSVEEQGELKSIIERVTAVLPAAGVGLDNYGKYLDIASQKTRRLIADNQGLDKVIALQSLPAQLEKLAELERKYANLTRIRNEFNSTGKFRYNAADATGYAPGTNELILFREQLEAVNNALAEQRKNVATLRTAAEGLGSALEDASVANFVLGGDIAASLGKAATGIGLLATLQERLKKLKEKLPTDNSEREIAADNHRIEATEKEIDRLEKLGKSSKALADLRKELAQVGTLADIFAVPAEGAKIAEQKIAILGAGIKKLADEGIVAKKVLRDLGNEKLRLEQSLLVGGEPIDFLPVLNVKKLETYGDKLGQTLGNALAQSLKDTPIFNQSIYIPIELKMVKTDFGKEILDTSITLQKAFSQNAAASLAFGKSFNQAGANAAALRAELQKLIAQGMNPLEPAFKKLAKDLQEAEAAEKAYNATTQQLVETQGLISNAIYGVANALGAAAGAVLVNGASAAQGLEIFFNGILSVISDFMISYGQKLIALGVAKVAAENLMTFGGGYGAIAAGAALVVIGGVLSAVNSGAASDFKSINSGGSAGSQPNYNSNYSSQRLPPLEIKIVGELVGRGSSLVGVVNSAVYRRQRTG